jgi:hypothetical protein
VVRGRAAGARDVSAADYARLVARQMREGTWEEQVVRWAHQGGWLAQHTRTAVLVQYPGNHRYVQTADYRADPGYPDWTFARAGVVLFAELKKDLEYPTNEQRGWMSALYPVGHHPDLGYVWKPSMADAVRAVLLGPPGGAE